MNGADNISRKEMLKEAGRLILEAIGEDASREGLRKTPERFSESIMSFTSGYRVSLQGKPQRTALK